MRVLLLMLNRKTRTPNSTARNRHRDVRRGAGAKSSPKRRRFVISSSTRRNISRLTESHGKSRTHTATSIAEAEKRLQHSGATVPASTQSTVDLTETVNTLPMETLDAYRDHGVPKARLEEDVQEARLVLERLPDLGINIDNVTRQLEDEGVEKFNKPFDKLMEILAQRSHGHLV